MKKLLTTILIISVSYAFAQDWTQQSDKLHYFTSEGKIEVTPDYNAVALYFAKTVDQSAATKLEAQLSSFNATTPANTSVMDMKGVMLLRNANVFGDFSTKAARDNFLAQYNRNGIQAYDMVPAFMVQDKQAWLTKRVMIKLKPGVNLDAIQNITSQYNTKFVRNVVGPDTYLLEVQDISKQFEFIQALQSQGVLEWGEPDFKMDLIKLEDPLYPDQWHLNNTGGSIDGFALVEDNDIDAPEAWTISTGNASVVVAVIDDGVEAHRDMSDLLPGFTPVNNGDGTPDANGDHGQACAGLIGALHNDLDARGVAPGSSFFSVNIFASNTSNADVATGVRWAAEQGGAHITSNSWGYGSCSSNLVQAVTDAFNWSAANGRGGLGTVSLVASGNDYGTCVSFPANLPSVIAVGGVDGAGVVSRYSNQGTALDITAPSNSDNGAVFYHGIRTLDREGSAGYSSGATTNSFGGTSAATPIAAGVAALVLAVDPSLTKTQVEDVLYNTAKDLGAPGRDNTFGHGVVNAHDALLSLNQEPDVTPPTTPNPFSASGIEDTKLVLSWGASTDDRAVAGYRIFQNGSELTTTSSTSLTVLNLTPSTTYSFEVEAYDGAGNTSDRATTQATTAEPKPCEEATNDDFESGWGNWVDGGSDARRSINDQAYANSGSYTVRLRDDSSSSFIRTNNLNFEGVSRVQIDFSYIVVGFDNAGEEFLLDYSTNGGSTWTQIEEWNLTDEFQNNQRKFDTVEFDATFTANTRFRFRNNASTNGDRVYLDDIVITSCTTTEPTDTESPSDPTNVAASSVTDSSADITWSASTDNVGVTGYDVYVNGTLDGSTASTSYSLTGLSPETSYSVGVKAKDAAGNESGEGTTSFTTGAFVDSQDPTQPTNLSSSNETTTSADITWTASTDNVGVTGYNVYVGGTLDGTTASTSYSLTGLSPETTYSVAVEATDAAGNTSTQASIDVTTLTPPDETVPSDPTNVAASSVTDSSADITWSASTDNVGVTGYDVYVNGTLDGSTASTSYSLTGLSPETSYSVGVRAKDAAGNESGEGTTSFTTGAFVDSQDPTQPTNLSSSNETTTSADITWTASTDNVGVTGYNVYVGGTLDGTTASTSYSLTGLSPETTYSVAVEATDAAGNTSTQASIDVTTLTPPDETVPSDPTNVAASSVTDSSADITWSASTDNVGVTGYDVYVNGTLDGSTASTSYSLTGLSPETSYSVGVRAKDAAGNESGEGTTSFTTGAFVDSQDPTQPTNLSSSNETTTSADITWTASTDNVGVTGYNVYVGGTLDGTTASTSYSLTGLSPETTYSVAVEATDAAGNTSTQASIDVTTLTPPDETVPSDPTNVTASSVTDSSADITWSASTDNVGVTGYDVYVNGSLNGSTASTSYSLTGLSPETSYSVGVKAKDAAGNESGEGTTSFTTTQTQSCQEQLINSEDFESGWGIWNDGGSDARRSSRDSQYANSGVFSVRLRDDTSTSVMFTDNLDLSGFEQLQVSFTYVARSMDNPNEDFFLEVSTDGGNSYSVVEEWNQGDEFVNGPRYFEQVSFAGTFTSNTRLRFRCDASGNSDWIYIDDVEISGCGPSTAAPILNSSSDFDFSSTLDAEDEDVEIVLYPNPVVETLNISNLPADARVQIFNFGGQLIMDKKSQDQIDLGSLQEGLYFVRIIHDGEVSSYTISKK